MICGADLWHEIDAGDPPGWALHLRDALIGMYPEDVGRLRDHRAIDFGQYRDAPVAYIREVLKAPVVQPVQERICELMLTPPHRVIVVSANNIGKSWLAGALTNWRYDCFDPGVTITTAPTKRDVEDVLWGQVRAQRRTRWDFKGDRKPELWDRPDHYAKGYTGTSVEAFHGRHERYMMFLLDEAIKLKTFVWTGIKSMFRPGGKHLLAAFLNPTDTTAPVYAECSSPNYHVIHLSALDHPNVLANLRGADEDVIEGAVNCDMLAGWFQDELWFEPVRVEDFQLGDVVWPPPWLDREVAEGRLPPAVLQRALERWGRDGKRFCVRPGPEGQARVLGIWPSATPGAVWSDLAWKCATRELPGMERLPIRWRRVPQIGCDVARGTSDKADKTEIIVQIEGVAVEHFAAAGWETTRTFSFLMELADKWARIFNTRRDPRITPETRPQLIPIKVDDGGLGGGVVDMLKGRGYGVVPINASTASVAPHRYPRMRDQLWFAVPLAARRGEIDISRLTKRSRLELRNQAMGVQWKPDEHGRRKVEPKEKTKERLLRSPDGMDALNLAYCAATPPAAAAPHVIYSYQGPLPSGQPQQPGPFSGGKRDAIE